jgi:phage terminase large subunit-like protein
LLRAEPIAGQFREDRIRLVGTHSKLEWEWQTWLPTGDSPGRIDASVHLAYSLLPVPGSETVVSSPARARPNVQGTRAGSRYTRPVGR